MAEPIRIMGIYAHPADVATEAAGTMAIHADRGDDVTCVVMSDGIRMRVQARNNRAASHEFLVALGRGRNVQVDGGISPPGYARRGGKTAERSGEPVAEATRISLHGIR